MSYVKECRCADYTQRLCPNCQIHQALDTYRAELAEKVLGMIEEEIMSKEDYGTTEERKGRWQGYTFAMQSVLALIEGEK
jgi:hypothetical protein